MTQNDNWLIDNFSFPIRSEKIGNVTLLENEFPMICDLQRDPTTSDSLIVLRREGVSRYNLRDETSEELVSWETIWM